MPRSRLTFFEQAAQAGQTYVRASLRAREARPAAHPALRSLQRYSMSDEHLGYFAFVRRISYSLVTPRWVPIRGFIPMAPCWLGLTVQRPSEPFAHVHVETPMPSRTV